MRWGIVAAVVLTLALAACSTTTEPPRDTVTETVTETATAAAKPPKPKKPEFTYEDCNRAWTFMQTGTLNWSLHKLSLAQHIADNGCWGSWLSGSLGEAFMSPSGTCAPALELMVRGVRSWRLEVVAEARAQLQAGACSDFVGFPG
jgi:hypothetical protein